MGTLRWARRFIWLFVLIGMFGLNVATLTVGAIADLADSLLSRSGIETARHELRDNLKREKARSTKLQNDLGREQKANQKLRKRAAILTESVRTTTRKVAARTVKGALRNSIAVAGESLPVAGAAVAVGVTGLELYEACQTMKDVLAIDVALKQFDDAEAQEGSDQLRTEESRVCGLEPPSLSGVWTEVMNAPEEVWEKMNRLDFDIPTLETLIPEWPTWSDIWAYWDWLLSLVGFTPDGPVIEAPG